MAEASASFESLVIKKYPNRRFYDTTRSCHVTLEDIHQLIRAGHDVQIIDSKQNRDITGAILAQIILEMDSFKLGVFPTGLLHQLIRSNDTLVHEFVNTYFHQAFEWFVQSRQAMEQQFRQTVGLAAPVDASSPKDDPWLALWRVWGVDPTPTAAADESADASDRVGMLQQRVDNLSRRVEQLQQALADTSSPADKQV